VVISAVLAAGVFEGCSTAESREFGGLTRRESTDRAVLEVNDVLKVSGVIYRQLGRPGSCVPGLGLAGRPWASTIASGLDSHTPRGAVTLRVFSLPQP